MLPYLRYIVALFTQKSCFERFGRILSSPFTVPLRQKDDIILNSISLTSQNNKISDTTKKQQQQQQQNVHIITGVHAGGDTATASANYCRPNTQIMTDNLKKNQKLQY